jgi:3-dehydroquinate synthase
MATIQIRSAAGAYGVHLSRGAISRVGALVARLGAASGVYVLSSPRVWSCWGAKMSRGIRGWRKNRAILFDDAESAKRLWTVEHIARQLIQAGADRHSVLVALGGGVVGDVAGFVAATYLRGVRLVHVPTTLVAQVDSSIGGKTGVDLPEGKNLIGAFYPPKLVVADRDVLATLPHREYRSGLYEVIKYGVIADRELFGYLHRNMLPLLRRDPRALAWVIPRCIRIKARVVEKDEREGGLRQILNFGHTLGHAFEAATHYRRFLHGEAVGLGMYAATLLALVTDRLNAKDAARIRRLVMAVGPFPDVPAIPAVKLRALLASDKKSREGSVRWVLPSRIGKTEWGVALPPKLVEKVVRALPDLISDARSESFSRASSRLL